MKYIFCSCLTNMLIILLYFLRFITFYFMRYSLYSFISTIFYLLSHFIHNNMFLVIIIKFAFHMILLYLKILNIIYYSHPVFLYLFRIITWKQRLTLSTLQYVGRIARVFSSKFPRQPRG